jgi:PadR family transcriptional regulator PadR
MISSDIIRGHLDSIILRLILEKDRYGYEISKEISRRTMDRFQIKEATLYAVFQRLEKKELITSYEGDVPLGRAFFREEIEEWRKTKEIIDIFMNLEEPK